MADVVLLRWPEERRRARELTEAGVAVLYVIKDGTDPPTPRSCLEDWVRVPGDERDLLARLAALESRAAAHQRPPSIDALGRLRHDGKLLVLAPEEARLAATLIARFGEVVADSELDDLTLDDQSSGTTSLRAHMARLRSVLRHADLALRRVRGKGYLLERR